MMYKYIKRILDVTTAVLGLILAFPILLIVSVLIKVESRGDVIFKQERLGLHGKVFKIYKFRSMRVGAEKEGSGVYSFKGDSRVTAVGRVIRATSIDELPQFINVIKGDMSIVGPRPVLTYHPWTIDKYTEEQLHMFDVRPGITGWAQVNGRKSVEWPRRIELNLEYVREISLIFDLKIIALTVLKVLLITDNNNVSKTD